MKMHAGNGVMESLVLLRSV